MIKTITECKDCMHKNVCARLHRPQKVKDNICENLKEDMNGIDIVVNCIDFIKVNQAEKELKLGTKILNL